MSREALVSANIGRDGRNLMIPSGVRKGTVVIDCNKCTLRYALFWKGYICITTIDLINGRSEINLPPSYFSTATIEEADNKDI